VLIARVESTSTSRIAAITSRGRVLLTTAAAIAEVTGRSRGVPTAEAFTTEKGESVLTVISEPRVAPIHDDLLGGDPPDEPAPLLLVTANGVMKRVTTAEVIGTQNTRTVITLKPGDFVVAAFPAADGTEVIAVASNAQALRTDAAGVSVQGRSAGGVAGMKLTEGATVVGAGRVATDDDTIVLTQTEKQTAKVTDVDEIAAKGRGTGGVRVTKFRDEKRVELAYVGPEAGVSMIVATAESPTKPDPSPEPLTIPHTGRDLISRKIPKRILAVGFGRW
jgi:DNA gyrase subunit A